MDINLTITAYVMQQMEKKDKTKQMNFTIGRYICREYLRQKINPKEKAG
ncbi:hypothetical protein [[Clostridium] polysaccharolyticum]|jgi:hypothetical protein|nr:hypothetical protein [[Clostridium] polysaccharolyticum]